MLNINNLEEEEIFDESTCIDSFIFGSSNEV